MQKSYTKQQGKVSNLKRFAFHLQVVKMVESQLSDIFKIRPLDDAAALVSTFPLTSR